VVEILFANQTWPHTNVGFGREAAATLSERGLNQPRTFCTNANPTQATQIKHAPNPYRHELDIPSSIL